MATSWLAARAVCERSPHHRDPCAGITSVSAMSTVIGCQGGGTFAPPKCVSTAKNGPSGVRSAPQSDRPVCVMS